MQLPDQYINGLLQSGTVIPAHPLALNNEGFLDEEAQRRLTRYYLASGAGGVAVAVHTTQFEIRKPEINLLESVLKLASEEIDRFASPTPVLKIAGILGPVMQAGEEAGLAKQYGYHYGLVSMGGLNNQTEKELVKRLESIAEVIPVFGFYLQPAVGGRLLSYGFWRDVSEIPNVHAIKVAAFNRYQSLDVVRAVCDSGRAEEIALYTGNDDNIVADLLTPYRFDSSGKTITKTFVGGLLGHWSVWTRSAVLLFNEIKQCIANNYAGANALLAKGIAITDMNAAIFDPANNFKGCIAGIQEVLKRQRLINNTRCLNQDEAMSPGQSDEISRVTKMYPELNDEAFVQQFLENDKQL